MKINFSARHFNASDNLQHFVTGEIGNLSKYFDGVQSADVVLAEHGSLRQAELRITMLGRVLTAKVEGEDFYKVVPKAVEKLEAQIKSTKSKAFGR